MLSGIIFSMNIMKNKKLKDIIIILICIFVSYNIITSVTEPYIEVKLRQEELQRKLDDATATNKELQKSLDQTENSKEVEEGYIRERFHMSEKDELIFVFPDE